jgi:carbon starvation protein
MLAGMALILATVVLVKLKKARYAWVTAVPCAWVLLTTLYAGWLKLFSPDPKISFVTHAQKFSTALAQGEILAPAKSVADMRQIIFNDWVDAALCGGFMLVVLMMLVLGLRAAFRAMASDRPTACEMQPQFREETARA